MAVVYFKVGGRFSMDWLRDGALALATDTYWQKLAVNALVDDFYQHQSQLTQNVLGQADADGDTQKATGKKPASRKAADGKSGAVNGRRPTRRSKPGAWTAPTMWSGRTG